MPLSAGHQLGPYEILAPIGAGGMGEVYKAKDTRLHREVALKILPPAFTNDHARRNRFETEAKAVAALNHPNIVALHDIGEANGVVFTITEFIEGDTLRNQSLPLRKAIETAAQIADGLAAAHAKGITHRDLKPDNVMLTKDGRAKILDFGLAQITRQNEDATLTAAGGVCGTAAYMSPEQVRGEQVDTRSDIFSFGALLYELLTRKKAFNANTPVESMNAVLKQILPRTLPPLGRLPLRRIRPRRSLHPGLPRTPWKMADLKRRRRLSRVEPQRPRTLLRLPRRQANGCFPANQRRFHPALRPPRTLSTPRR